MPAVLAYHTAALLAGVLPAAIADALAFSLARLAFAFRVPARRTLERNLERVLPALGSNDRARCARSSFESFALAFSRFMRGGRRTAARPRVIGRDHLEAARASGRGVILLSAHFGDWERGAAWLASRGVVVHVAARPHASLAVERLFARRRAAAGVRVLPPDSMFASSAAALRRGEWLALMADRTTAHSQGGSVCSWAAALARRCGALVLPAVCVRGAGDVDVLCFEPPLTPERCREGAFRDTMRGWLARWAGQWAAFERLPEGMA